MRKLLLNAVLLIFIVSCSKDKIPIAKKPAVYFESIPSKSTGVNFSNDLFYRDDLNIIEYLYYYNGGGVALGDINNDGLDDIYLTANQKPDKLFLNLGELKFKDITKKSGMLIDSTWSTGVTMEDVNNDGLLDIYVCKVGNYKLFHGHNLLYINNGNNTFTESSKAYGLDFSGLSTQASFFDYDNDGDMDMYLMNHSVHTPRSYGDVRIRKVKDSLSGDKLFENKIDDGLEKFIDVTEASGIYSSPLGYGLALSTSDINNDGLIDIYVGNDFHENDYLYINQGNKTFKESDSDYFSHNSRFTMGVDIADLNNDGKQDIMTLDMMPYDHEIFLKSAGEDSDKVTKIKKNFGFGDQYGRNTLQLNRDNKSFYDVALMTKTYATDWSWSVLLQDYNNDGLEDIFVTNGIYKRPNDLDYINYLSNINFSKYNQTKQNEIERKLIEEMPTIKLTNIIFHNKGNLEFERLTDKSGLKPSYSNGSAYSDLDNDGDLDLVVNNINQEASILENKSPGNMNNNYITISLEGDSINKNPTGSKVYVYTKKKCHFKELTATRGFLSSSTHKIHFGLGSSNKIDSIKVFWLDGKIQTEKNLSVNQLYTIKKHTLNTNLFNSKSIAKSKTNSLEPFPFVHLENNYLDYEREPLMPENLSTEGPALVKADFNGDGLEDIYIGGAKYQSPALFLKQKNGSYISDKSSDFIVDAIYEDVDATAFDYDNDGDLDLYVMSGGNEQAEGSTYLEDRVYINDGNATFKRLNAPLIKSNGGSVSSGDFDGDGYTDLFIGSRSIPGGYGLSPYSYILKNNGKGSFNIVEKYRFGMVTDSQWVDINNDKLLDLVIVGDWMPITIYINKGNAKFENETKKYGLEYTHGMWNTILVTDLNGDGTNDIIGGNAGLNFKLKASKERPVKLYIDDFDSNKQVDPIIFYDFFGNYIPFASRDKLVGQLPYLKKKFLTYNKFSKVSDIKSLTGKDEKNILEVKKIEELRSMVYLNLGDIFKEIPMPREAQISTIEDMCINQDGDNKLLIFVGNFFGYTSELGKSDSNSGSILKINKDGELQFLKNLPLPIALNARRIVEIDKNKYLVVSNNDKSYTFKLK